MVDKYVRMLTDIEALREPLQKKRGGEPEGDTIFQDVAGVIRMADTGGVVQACLNEIGSRMTENMDFNTFALGWFHSDILEKPYGVSRQNIDKMTALLDDCLGALQKYLKDIRDEVRQ